MCIAHAPLNMCLSLSTPSSLSPVLFPRSSFLGVVPHRNSGRRAAASRDPRSLHNRPTARPFPSFLPLHSDRPTAAEESESQNWNSRNILGLLRGRSAAALSVAHWTRWGGRDKRGERKVAEEEGRKGEGHSHMTSALRGG